MLLLVWTAFLGADVAWRRGQIICVDILTRTFPEKLQRLIELVVYLLMLTALGFMFVYSLRRAWTERIARYQSMPIPGNTQSGGGLPVHDFFYTSENTESLSSAVRKRCFSGPEDPRMNLVIICFIIFLLMGMPLAFVIGIAAFTFFITRPMLPFEGAVQMVLLQSQSFVFLAVPFFIFAGNLMNISGITSRLLGLARLLTRRMYGGTAQISVVMSTLMGGVSGSATADAAMGNPDTRSLNDADRL